MAMATSCEEDADGVDGSVDGSVDDEDIVDTEFPEDLEAEDEEDVTLFPDLTQVILEDEKLEISGYSNSYVELNGLSGLTITGDVTSLAGSMINLNSIDARLYLPAVSYDELYLIEDQILIQGRAFSEGNNADVRAYYNYIYIEPISLTETYYPAIISYMGVEAPVEKSTIYTGADMPLGDKIVDQIFLKRGHQIVVAASEDGIDSSRCYIAASDDLTIELEDDLINNISFMRCLPIDYVTKRGAGGKAYHSYVPPLNLSWFYTWQTTPQQAISAGKWPIPSAPLTNFMPMFWNNASDSAIQTIIESEAPVVYFLNEPDNSNQANVSVDTAVTLYAKVLAMGVRIVTPSVCAINNWDGSSTNSAATWIHNFMSQIIAKGYRYDGVGLHYYANGRTYTSANIASSSLTHYQLTVDSCYERYGKPVFITEFNIEESTNNSSMTDDELTYAFFRSVLPWFEETDYVERYALFPPTSSVAWLRDSSTQLSEGGEIYCNEIPNTPSIVWADDTRVVVDDVVEE